MSNKGLYLGVAAVIVVPLAVPFFIGCATLTELTTSPKPMGQAEDQYDRNKTFERSVWELEDYEKKLNLIMKYCLVQRLAPGDIDELDKLHVVDSLSKVEEIIHEALLPHDPIKATSENEFLTVVLQNRIDYLVSRGGIHPGQKAAELWLDDLGRDVVRLGVPTEEPFFMGRDVVINYRYPNGKVYNYKHRLPLGAWQHTYTVEQFERAKTRLRGTFPKCYEIERMAKAERTRGLAIDSRTVNTGYVYDSLRAKHILLDIVPLPWPRSEFACEDGISWVASINLRLKPKPFYSNEDSCYYFNYKYIIYNLSNRKNVLVADSQTVIMAGIDKDTRYFEQIISHRFHCMVDDIDPGFTPKDKYVCGLIITNHRDEVWQTSEKFTLYPCRPVTLDVKGMVLEDGLPNVTNNVYQGDTAEILLPVIGMPYYPPKELYHGHASFYFIPFKDDQKGEVSLSDFGLYDETRNYGEEEDAVPKLIPQAYLTFSSDAEHSHQRFRVAIPEDLKIGRYHLYVVIEGSADYTHPTTSERVPVVRGYVKVNLRKGREIEI